MGLDAGTPPGLRETIQRIAEEAVAKFARSGFLRNASISDGGLTIKGGFFRLRTKATGGADLFYLGPGGPSLPDGTAQQIWIVKRADGTDVLQLFDASPGADGATNQALTWRDRAGNIVLADDTDSGQGIARPYLPGAFFRARYGDWTVSTTSATFETLWRAEVYHQQPRLSVATMASMDTSGTTGEIRVMVDNVQMGPTVNAVFQLTTSRFGPVAAAGEHMQLMTVEIQGRRTSATGALRVEPLHLHGNQS